MIREYRKLREYGLRRKAAVYAVWTRTKVCGAVRLLMGREVAQGLTIVGTVHVEGDRAWLNGLNIRGATHAD